MRSWVPVLALLLVACASPDAHDDLRASSHDSEDAPAGCGLRVGAPDDLTAEPNWAQTGVLYRWRDEHGCPIRVDVIEHFRGDDHHCDMGSVEIIRVGTPLGKRMRDAGSPDVRTFVWDPSDVLGRDDDVDRARTIDRDQLPATATDTTFRLADTELWSDVAADDVLYRVRSDRVQVLTEDVDGRSNCA